MKNILLFLLITSFLITDSCEQKQKTEEAVVAPEVILHSLISYLKYEQNQINYSNNVKTYDQNFKPISINVFFQRLEKGYYLPLRIKTNGIDKVYRLYILPSKVDKDIKTTIVNNAKVEHQYYKMVGKPFPEFKFKDLNDKMFSNETLKNKIVVYKTWFIHCKTCIQEMPELNQIVESYKSRKDVVFISLALDKKAELVKFSQKNNFKYNIIPNQKNLIEGKLRLNSYPTHIIVNQFGKIVLVTNSVKKMHKRLSEILRSQ